MDGTIGVFVNSTEGYQGCIIREIEEAAGLEGIAVEVFDAQHTAVKNAQDLVRFEGKSSGRQSCAFVVPEADASEDGGNESGPSLRLAERLLHKGVGWVTLNHGREDLIKSLQSRFPSLPVGLVAVDNVAFGRTQAMQLRTLLPAGGVALSVRGNPLDTACRDRSLGLKQGLQDSSIALEELDARWEAELAERMVHKWVSTRRQAALHAVVCQNDHMGFGARRALVRAAQDLGRSELNRLYVIGGDGLPEMGQRWVDEGTLTATVCVTLPGRPAVELLARHWAGRAPVAPVTRLAVRSYPALSALSPAKH
jgi:hypothetical protein